MVNEKNKYYTIFESLYDPVILVDGDLCIEGMNEAAAEHFYDGGQRDTFSYNRPPVTDVFPWLAKEITGFASSDDHEVVLEKVVDTPLGERAFEVKMKHMLDATEKYQGTVVILNDLTERKQKEEALVLNEAIEQWVNTLVDIGHRVSTMDDVEGVLPFVVGSARDLLHTEFAALGMWDREAECFAVRCVAGRDDIAAQLFRDLGFRDLGLHGLHPAPEDGIATLSVPLIMNDEVVGALLVGRHDPFPQSAAVVLQSLANQAVIAVEHSVMAQRMRSLAVFDERTRIAREMHDGLAQILGFLNLEMQSLEVLARQNRVEETIAELRNARARILEAHAEVRENILSLRTALSGDTGPITALTEYLREFGAQSGVTVRLAADVGDDDVTLSSMTQVQLVRIVQGALVNVRRHARAANVGVSFARESNDLRVVVEDDGVGFDVRQVAANIGLQSMRERTASVGGSLEIDSEPGRGTRIRLRVPLEAGRRALQPAG
jgi:signal transduction histidine kinase